MWHSTRNFKTGWIIWYAIYLLDSKWSWLWLCICNPVRSSICRTAWCTNSASFTVAFESCVSAVHSKIRGNFPFTWTHDDKEIGSDKTIFLQVVCPVLGVVGGSKRSILRSRIRKRTLWKWPIGYAAINYSRKMEKRRYNIRLYIHNFWFQLWPSQLHEWQIRSRRGWDLQEL